MGIKHRADSGFRKFRTLIKVRFVRTVKYFEMPYVSYPRPLSVRLKDDTETINRNILKRNKWQFGKLTE